MDAKTGRDVVVNDLLLLRFEIFVWRFEKAFEIRNQIKVEWMFEVMRIELQFRLLPLRVFALLGRMCETISGVVLEYALRGECLQAG